jgi:DNA-binding GntR family transcriptional regulator
VDEDNYFWCYPKFLRFHRTWELRDVELSELSPDFLDAHNDFHDKLWKACQRGIFNGAMKRKSLYTYLGFDYTLKP